MTQDEIIRFAIRCRLVTRGNSDGIYMDALTDFAKLVAAKEREACAKVCDDWPNGRDDVYSIAAAIRARGQE
jgi:hypothetical protein